MTQPLLQAADLRAAARLTTDAVIGLTSLVEALHARVATPPWLARAVASAPHDDRTRGATGLVYETVRGVTRVAGGSVDALLGLLAPVLAAPAARQPPHPDREAVVAALNGVLGDHLAATDSTLATTMAFRIAGQALPLERHALRSRVVGATPKVIVLLHGLCMSDLQWRREGHHHGEQLALDLGYTAVHLHYNSGLSISTNGRILAQLMEKLYDSWPVPIQRLVMLGHSMGGLVARSAIHHAAFLQRGALRWPNRVNDLVGLGVPHQGAPLERAGHGVDLLLEAAPYAAPLARLGRLRSAGIQDLRQGNILSAPVGDDGAQRSEQVGLPAATRCYAVAGTLGAERDLKSKLLGDGLVPVSSALGQHQEPGRRLHFEPECQAVVPGTGHLDLLSSPQVYAQLRQWLA